jgi:uncharacterized protein
MPDLEEYREYYGKCQIRARAMRNGLLEGEALFYAENGQLIQRSSFKAGQLHGEMLIYDRDGHSSNTRTITKGSWRGQFFSTMERI